MIIEKLNEALEKKNSEEVRRPREKHKYYPSSASVRVDGKVEGACARKEYWQITLEPSSNPPAAKNLRIMASGKRAEEAENENAKAAGILVDEQTKFQHIIPPNGLRSHIVVSGALDGIYELDGKKVIVEWKSVYGDWSQTHILGVNKWGKPSTELPYPRIEHLLQSMLYLDHYKGEMDTLYLVYIDRGNGLMREFIITLNASGTAHISSGDDLGDTRFTVADIYARFIELDGYIQRKELPARDFNDSHFMCASFCPFRDRCKGGS